MNHVVLLRVLLMLAVLLSIIAGSIDALLPPLLQAYWLGPHAYSGLAFMVSYAGKVAWGAALGLASMVTSASTVNAARTATPATG
jgi:hypothetical protein